jgi:hypothetical protein
MFETELARATLPAFDRRLYPILKAPDYAYRGLVAHLPLPGIAPEAGLPIVTFGENGPQGYVFLTAHDADGMDLSVLYRQSMQRLASLPRDAMHLSPKLLVHGGGDLAAEALLDEAFLRRAAATVGDVDILVCVPHRAACYVLAANAPRADHDMLRAVVITERARMAELGHAPVSDLMFRVRDGKIVGTQPFSTKPLAAPGKRGLNWLAFFVYGFIGFAAGLGLAILLTASGKVEVYPHEGVFAWTIAILAALAAGGLGARKG